MTDWLGHFLKLGLPAAAIGVALYAGLRSRNAGDSDGEDSFGSDSAGSSDSDSGLGGDSGGGGDGGGD